MTSPGRILFPLHADEKRKHISRSAACQIDHKVAERTAPCLQHISGKPQKQHIIKLRKEHSENLWDDLVDLCRCEEFTFFLTFAYRINNIAPQDELWELVRSTRGWGRIFTLYDLECTTEEEEIWLLRHGCEIEIDYATICLVVMRKGQLLHHFFQSA